MFSTNVNSVNGSQKDVPEEDSTNTNKWRAAPKKPAPKMFGFGKGAMFGFGKGAMSNGSK